MQRMHIAVSDSYDNISVFSIYWKSDDTSGAEDSSRPFRSSRNVQPCQRSLSDDVSLPGLGAEIADEQLATCNAEAASFLSSIMRATPLLVVHSTASFSPPEIGQELGSVPEMNMPFIKHGLKDMSSKSLGLNVLLVMDSCCAAIAGLGGKAKSARVELMATACKGISNSREDERAFTQHWCEAFTKLLEIGKPFICDDIIKDITPDSGRMKDEIYQSHFVFILAQSNQLYQLS